PSTLDIPLKRLPCGDSERYSWIDPRPHPQDDRRCGNCHAEIYEEWRRSSHAGSATNPRFLNLYDGSDGEGHPRVGWSLQEEYPEGVGVCTNCHAPSVSLTDPAYFDVRQAQGTDALGVHCDFCHKIQNVNLPAPGLTHGRDGLTLLRPLHEPLFFGSLDDADQRADTYAPVYEQSLYCAPCHEGVVFGVHVYSTYSEWLVSRQAAARQHCQACHMPRCGTLRNIAPGRGGVPRDPATLASHADLGERADRLRRCLQIEVHAQRLSSGVTAHVTLGASGVGHQLPTGYIDRQLILLVQALDSRGVLVNLRDGSRLPAIIGSWAGQPGRLYAKQPQDFAGLSPAPFWRAQPALLDTRLAPDQSERATFVFDATAVSVRVQVVYRRFWEQVTRIKKWPVDDLTIFDEKLPVSPKH
ncbi:MAG TPA: multiheme c-type cytochrome, partial [Candidatus Anammoximicrobium sp.]|nr:multiheme c-type cytochrome [Candidatus Anammoximicrobium sp.]